jgi:UDP-glucose 4-epimerase
VSAYLVTGGAGFIGSHLCDRLLAEGKRVVAVDSLASGKIANLANARGYGQQFAFENFDIRGEGMRTVFERHRPDVVLHLAAQASVSRSMEDPALDAGINLMGLLNVLECAARSGTRKVVFAASGGTLYGEPRSLPVKETARKGSRPVSPYGISKKAAELYLHFFRKQRGLDFTALALANVYGPRQDPHGEAGVVAIFSRAMLAGEQPVIFGDGKQTRDYVFVEDTVHAFSLATDPKRGSGQLMNVGTGVETSVNTIHELIAGHAGYTRPPHYAPAREGDVERSALSVEFAAAQLGWKPWTPLQEGLLRTVDSHRTL